MEKIFINMFAKQKAIKKTNSHSKISFAVNRSCGLEFSWSDESVQKF